MILSLLRLIRVQNLLTALADSVAGFLLFHPLLSTPTGLLWRLGGLSICLYSAGMVFNDLHDLSQDKVRFPHRPLVQEEFAKPVALGFGLFFLLLGLLLAGSFSLDVLLVAFLMTLLLLGYNFGLKESPWTGSPVLGLLRALNFFLGILAATHFTAPLKFLLILPLVYFAYMTSLTWMSYFEEELPYGKFPVSLLLSFMVLLFPLAFVAAFHLYPSASYLAGQVWGIILSFFLVAGGYLYLLLRIVRSPVGKNHTLEILRFGLLGIFIFYALLLLAFHRGYEAGFFLTLILPTLFLQLLYKTT